MKNLTMKFFFLLLLTPAIVLPSYYPAYPPRAPHFAPSAAHFAPPVSTAQPAPSAPPLETLNSSQFLSDRSQSVIKMAVAGLAALGTCTSCYLMNKYKDQRCIESAHASVEALKAPYEAAMEVAQTAQVDKTMTTTLNEILQEQLNTYTTYTHFWSDEWIIEAHQRQAAALKEDLEKKLSLWEGPSKKTLLIHQTKPVLSEATKLIKFFEQFIPQVVTEKMALYCSSNSGWLAQAESISAEIHSKGEIPLLSRIGTGWGLFPYRAFLHKYYDLSNGMLTLLRKYKPASGASESQEIQAARKKYLALLAVEGYIERSPEYLTEKRQYDAHQAALALSNSRSRQSTLLSDSRARDNGIRFL